MPAESGVWFFFYYSSKALTELGIHGAKVKGYKRYHWLVSDGVCMRRRTRLDKEHTNTSPSAWIALGQR